MLEYDDLKVHRTSISDSSADVYSNTQQNRIEGTASGHHAAEQTVASRGEISFYWDQINQFVWELGKLEYSTDLEVYILKKLKELTGATAAVMSSYDEYTKTLNTRHVELDTWLANKVLSLLDKPINQIKSPVDDATYAEIFNTEIGMRKDLYESSENHGGRVSHDSVETMMKALPSISIYVWDSDNKKHDGHLYGAVHAKCAVADGELAFITSANLTTTAMESNMELGLLVRKGDIPSGLERHLDALITTKVITKVR